MFSLALYLSYFYFLFVLLKLSYGHCNFHSVASIEETTKRFGTIDEEVMRTDQSVLLLLNHYAYHL